MLRPPLAWTSFSSFPLLLHQGLECVQVPSSFQIALAALAHTGRRGKLSAMAIAAAVADPAMEKDHSEEDFICPVSFDAMVDPVKCSDGVTYCRYSVYKVMDNGLDLPGCEGGVVEIRGNFSC